MKTVIHITEEGRGGGPLKIIQQICTALKGEINSVVVCPTNSEKFLSELESYQIKTMALPIRPMSKELKKIFCYLFYFIPEVLMFKKIISEQQADLVVCHQSSQIKGIIAAKLAKTPCIWYMHDTYQPKIVLLLFNFVSRLCDSYIHASEKTKSYYSIENGFLKGKNNWVVQSMVDTKRFIPKGSNILNQYDSYKIISVGYININKGFEYLIRAASILKKSQQFTFDFFILGPLLESRTSFKNKLDQLIKEHQLTNIHFLGYQSNVEDYINAADLYVCSSIYESSPIAVWEALSCSQFVLSTNVGDIPAIFKAHNCGWVIPTQNPDILAEKIVASITEPKRNIMKTNARKTAIDFFDVQARCRDHLHYYNRVMT